MTRILVVDNYDSFVFNLVQYMAQLGAEVEVRRNDEVDVARAGGFAGILLSPGPGAPEGAGRCVELVRRHGVTTPVLGVCLGHQVIATAYGGRVERASELLHGKTSQVRHDGRGVFAGLPEPLTATRYHSLVVPEAGLPDELEVSARAESGAVMGLRHRSHPVEGVQFHPESILTQAGHLLLANWLSRCGSATAMEQAPALSAQVEQLRLSAVVGGRVG